MTDVFEEQPTVDETAGRDYPPVVFINWPVHDASFDTADLIDGTDFAGYKVAFLDVLEFSRAHGLWDDTTEIGTARYISFSESKLKRYLKYVRMASQGLQLLLRRGGILVVRGNIPNAHIKVRKKTNRGTQSYTDAVVSAFFWLEDIIGAYSIQYCKHRTLKYHQRVHPLRRAFGKCEVNCLQTIRTVANGRMDRLATLGGTGTSAAAIARIAMTSSPGQVFVIPQFVVPQESVRLVEAFTVLVGSKYAGGSRPTWVDDLEDDLERLSPLPGHIEEAERQINALDKQITVLKRRQDQVLATAGVLFETGENLRWAVGVVLELLGFEYSQQDHGGDTDTLQSEFAGRRVRRAVVKTQAVDEGPVAADHVSELRRIVAQSTLKTPPKAILVANVSPAVPPDRRGIFFELEAIEEANQGEVCLISTRELFDAARWVVSRLSVERIGTLTSSLRRDILECDGEFRLNRKKFAI